MLIIDQSEISETAKIFSDVCMVNSVIGDDTVIGNDVWIASGAELYWKV